MTELGEPFAKLADPLAGL